MSVLAAAVDAARVQQLDIMPAAAARWTTSRASNGRGGATTSLAAAPWTYPDWAGTVPDGLPAGWLPARLARPTDRVLLATADQYGTSPRWVLTLPAGVALDVGDVVAVEHLDTGLEVVGTVGAIYSDPSGVATATRALLVADGKGRTREDLP